MRPSIKPGTIKLGCIEFYKIIIKNSIEKQSAGNQKVNSALRAEKFTKRPQVFAQKNWNEDREVSVHLRKHRRPENSTDIGYYLAGLIEGGCCITSEQGFEMVFHEFDFANAYYIKKIIGYGSVTKIKENAVKLTIFHSKGVDKVWSLVNGKFIAVDQARQRAYEKRFNKLILPPSTEDIIQTYWLAGFADANGSFSIFISKNSSKISSDSPEIEGNVNGTIPFRVTQIHSRELLSVIQTSLGGIIYQTTDKTCTVNRYSTVSFYHAKSVASYFDKYHLINNSK